MRCRLQNISIVFLVNNVANSIQEQLRQDSCEKIFVLTNAVVP